MTFSPATPVPTVSYDDAPDSPECSTTTTTSAPFARASATATRTAGTMSRTSTRPRTLSRSQTIVPGVVAPTTATRTAPPARDSITHGMYAFRPSAPYTFAASIGNAAWAIARLRYGRP